MLIIVGTSSVAVTRNRATASRTGARFESRHEDVLAAHRGHEESRGAVRQMEHRSGVEVDDIRAEPERGRAIHRVGDDVAMAQHHALRTSGRAPGVEDAGEIIAPLARVGDGSALGDQVFVGEQSLGREAVAGTDHVAQLRADFAQHRQEGVVDEQRRTAGILEPERNLRRRESRVDRHENEAAPGHREEIFEVAVAVEREHADAVAGTVAERRHRAGEGRRARLEFAPRPYAAFAFRRDALGPRLHGSPEELRDLNHVRPPLFFAAAHRDSSDQSASIRDRDRWPNVAPPPWRPNFDIENAGHRANRWRRQAAGFRPRGRASSADAARRSGRIPPARRHSSAGTSRSAPRS